VTWQRRIAPPVLGAGVATATAAIVGALTHPYAERANEAYREGAQTGLVIRYTVLGALFGWLADVLFRGAQRHGSLRATVAARGSGLLAAGGIVAVLAAAVVPIFVGGYDESDRLRDERAGFIDGCTRRAPRHYCDCMYDTLRRDPRADSSAEIQALFADVQVTGKVPPLLRRVAAKCAG
jgi:hypothetical protein